MHLVQVETAALHHHNYMHGDVGISHAKANYGPVQHCDRLSDHKQTINDRM